MRPNIPEEFVQHERGKSKNENPDAENDQNDQSRRRVVCVFDDFSHFLEENDQFALIFVPFTTVDNKANSLEALDFQFRIRVFAREESERRSNPCQEFRKQVSFVVRHHRIHDFAPMSQRFSRTFEEILKKIYE